MINDGQTSGGLSGDAHLLWKLSDSVWFSLKSNIKDHTNTFTLTKNTHCCRVKLGPTSFSPLGGFVFKNQPYICLTSIMAHHYVNIIMGKLL